MTSYMWLIIYCYLTISPQTYWIKSTHLLFHSFGGSGSGHSLADSPGQDLIRIQSRYQLGLWCHLGLAWGRIHFSDHSSCSQNQYLAATDRASISSWLLAGSCLQLLELPTVPGYVGFSTMFDFKAHTS